MTYTYRIVKPALLCVVSFLFTCSLSQGQMRVGLPAAPPDGSATLDISSGPYSTGNQYRGIAPPKISLVQSSQSQPITKPTVGLLVYNTATTNDLSPGYYYWGGSQWLRFVTASPGAGRVAAVSGQSIPAYLINQVTTLSTPDIIYIADEGKEGVFRYQASSAATVDGATVLQASNGRYKRIITDGVDVRWFGAKGDGNTDDTQALQKAIDFAASSTEKNSTVFIPTSFVCPVYTLVVKPTVTLELKSNSIVRGKPLSGSESIDTPIIQLNDGANLIGLGMVDGNKDSRFIVADASKPDQKTWSTGVRVLNTSKASLIRDITVMNCGDGVWFQNTPSLRIQNCIFRYNGNRVIQGVITDNAIITGNFIDGGAHGIQWFGDPGKSDYCEHWTVSNNIVKNVAGGGIWGSYGRLITITGNNVENCGDVGIDPEYSQDVTVSANTVKNCTNGALTTFNVCQRIMFADNVVWQQANYGPGIKLYGINVNGLTGKTAHVNILGGSILMDNNRNAIETDQDVAEHVSVEAITVICNGSGQAIRSLDCNNTAIVRNKLLAKSSNIVSLEGGSRGRIENNTIEYIGSSPAGIKGVYLYWRSSAYPAKQNNVVSNRLVNCGAGIMDDAWGDNASYSRIEDNETTTVSYQGTLGASYTGFVRGNHNDNNSLVDGSNRYSIKPFITPNSGDVLRYDGANWTNSTSASSSEVSVNTITGGDGGSFPFLILPASGPNTYDNSVVDITLGGWYGNGKKRIRLTAGQRDGLSVAYTVLGSTSAMGSIKAYTNNGVTTFYAMVGQFGQINIHYVNLHGATGVQNLQNTTPVGNLAFNSDDTPPYLEVTATSMKNSGANIYTETNLKTGTSTLASNGSATYSIPHALGATPVWWNVQPATATASAASFYVTADATNIVVHYSTPPANTGNLSFTWAVKR